jgi:integration host factor subunit beta
MTKTQLIDRVATQCHCSLVQAEIVVNTILKSTQVALMQGDRVELRGFGTFEVRSYESYTGRNPKTGEPVAVEAKRAPFFKAGKELKERLNQQD